MPQWQRKVKEWRLRESETVESVRALMGGSGGMNCDNYLGAVGVDPAVVRVIGECLLDCV